MTVTEQARPPDGDLDLVGITEIADRLGVRRATVDKWRHRGILPPPDYDLASGPVWWWRRVAAWARRTGRL